MPRPQGATRQDRDKQPPEPGRACIPSLQGGTRVLPCPSATSRAPVSLCSGNKVFGAAGKVAPKGGLSRVQDSPPGWPCCRDLVQTKAIGEDPSFHLIDMLGVLQRAKDPAVCLAPGLEQLLGVTVTGVSRWHWWGPLPSPCCCLGTAELRGTIPMDLMSLS